MFWNQRSCSWLLATLFAAAALWGADVGVAHSEELPNSGKAHWRVTQIVHPLGELPFGPFGVGRSYEEDGSWTELGRGCPSTR